MRDRHPCALPAVWALTVAATAAAWMAAPTAVWAGPGVSVAYHDPRLRSVLYSADEIYRLPGYVGYQIDVEFQQGESFVALGSGDVQGLAFAAKSNHLFIKPRAPNVHTNLTVLTTRRTYHFDYATQHSGPGPEHADVIYVLRFLYADAAPQRQGLAGQARAASPPPPAASPEALLAQVQAQGGLERNTDYRFCGSRELQPLEAWDDGVQTHLRFGPRTELPAVFVRNSDGSESLVNFHVQQGEVVVHRVARRFDLRRGQMSGCVINRGFRGSAAALPTGTISPAVRRVLREGDR